jgi:hypothetical protein
MSQSGYQTSGNGLERGKGDFFFIIENKRLNEDERGACFRGLGVASPSYRTMEKSCHQLRTAFHAQVEGPGSILGCQHLVDRIQQSSRIQIRLTTSPSVTVSNPHRFAACISPRFDVGVRITDKPRLLEIDFMFARGSQ